jgi:hypothetical protein
MKFLSWIGLILVILAIVASITSPGDKKFTEFINKDKGGDTMSCKPVITKSTDVKLFVKLASIKYVSYCESGTPLVITGKEGEKIPTQYSIPKITHSETYLGLFGRFWKL